MSREAGKAHTGFCGEGATAGNSLPSGLPRRVGNASQIDLSALRTARGVLIHGLLSHLLRAAPGGYQCPYTPKEEDAVCSARSQGPWETAHPMHIRNQDEGKRV